MNATDFLALAASDPDRANRHIAKLLGVEPAALYVANSPWTFFELWDALPRHFTESWFLHEARGLNEARGYRVGHTKRGAGGLSHYAPTRNLAVAAALSEAMHEEKDDG